jgi:hypothetical protein
MCVSVACGVGAVSPIQADVVLVKRKGRRNYTSKPPRDEAV